MKVSTVEEMREMDKSAVSQYNVPPEILMENAGHAVAKVINDHMRISGKKFIVFCGAGNNGGDGFVVARLLHSMGGVVKVFVLNVPGDNGGAAQLNYQIISRLPVSVYFIKTLDGIGDELKNCDAIVDAIFGTGLSRNVTGIYQQIIESINNSQKIVFSVDIPSGVNGDNGQVMGVAVQAAHTVTFGLPKIGSLLYPGYSLCGSLYCTHISFTPELYNSKSISVEINNPSDLPPRDPSGHKGQFGDLLCIAGSANYYGAPYFAAYSFLRSGGGYSRLAAPKSIIPFIASKSNEIVYYPLEEANGIITKNNLDYIEKLSQNVDVVILGPGVSLDETVKGLVRETTTRIMKPLIIDGDGLTAISSNLSTIFSRSAPTILTPHLGEMSRLTGLSISSIKSDPISILRKFSRETNAIVVLKGAHSLIGLPDGRVYINLSGNSGMATAGSGDVLTGTIAAMFGLGLKIEEAVRKGVFIHGAAGDLAAMSKGEDGITAQDILDHLPQAIKCDRSSFPKLLSKKYAVPEVI